MDYGKILNNLRNASYAKHFLNVSGDFTVDVNNALFFKGEFGFLADNIGQGITLLNKAGYRTPLQRALLYKALEKKGFV